MITFIVRQVLQMTLVLTWAHAQPARVPAENKSQKDTVNQSQQNWVGNKSAQIEVIKRSLRPVVPKTLLHFRPPARIPETFPFAPMQKVDRRLAPVELEPLRKSSTYNFIWIDEYLWDNNLEGVGAVTEIEGGMRTASNGQTVFFESESGLRVDDALFAYRAVPTSLGGWSGGPVRIENIANLKVTAIVNNNGERLYKAVVLNANRYVEAGDKLGRGKMPTVEFSAVGQNVALRADVISPNDPPVRRLGDFGTFIFLSGGHNEGFREDQILSVMSNPQSRNSDSKYDIPIGAIALIKIVKVAEHYSTALVVAAHDAIYPGDFTASPDRFVESDRSILERKVIDLSEDAIKFDPWAKFRPYMNQPIPFIDMQEARQIELDSNIQKAEPNPEESEHDSDDGWMDEGG